MARDRPEGTAVRGTRRGRRGCFFELRFEQYQRVVGKRAQRPFRKFPGVILPSGYPECRLPQWSFSTKLIEGYSYNSR